MSDPAHFVLEHGATSMRLTLSGPLTFTTAGLELFADPLVGAPVEDWTHEHRGVVKSATVANNGIDLTIEWTA